MASTNKKNNLGTISISVGFKQGAAFLQVDDQRPRIAPEHIDQVMNRFTLSIKTKRAQALA